MGKRDVARNQSGVIRAAWPQIESWFGTSNQTELAARLGIAQGALSMFVSAERNLPPDASRKLAELLGHSSVEKMVQALAAGRVSAPKQAQEGAPALRHDGGPDVAALAIARSQQDAELKLALIDFYGKHHDQVARAIIVDYATRPHKKGARTQAQWLQAIVDDWQRICRGFELPGTEFQDE